MFVPLVPSAVSQEQGSFFAQDPQGILSESHDASLPKHLCPVSPTSPGWQRGQQRALGRWRESSYPRQPGRKKWPKPPSPCCPQVNPDTGYINYDQLEENARLFHPKLIIAGEEPGGAPASHKQACVLFPPCPHSLLVSAAQLSCLGLFPFLSGPLVLHCSPEASGHVGPCLVGLLMARGHPSHATQGQRAGGRLWHRRDLQASLVSILRP